MKNALRRLEGGGEMYGCGCEYFPFSVTVTHSFSINQFVVRHKRGRRNNPPTSFAEATPKKT